MADARLIKQAAGQLATMTLLKRAAIIAALNFYLINQLSEVLFDLLKFRINDNMAVRRLAMV